MPQYKLTYFAVRGLGEAIRYVFAQANVPYENIEIKMEEWPAMKACEL